MNITVKKDEIQAISSNILDNANYLNDEIKKLNDVIEKINIAWEGADALEYIEAMRFKYVKGLEYLTDMVERYGNYLGKIPDAYTLLDESFENRKINV